MYSYTTGIDLDGLILYVCICGSPGVGKSKAAIVTAIGKVGKPEAAQKAKGTARKKWKAGSRSESRTPKKWKAGEPESLQRADVREPSQNTLATEAPSHK